MNIQQNILARNGRGLLYIITGPCSYNIPEELTGIAQSLHDRQLADLFRVGLWKPRTLPKQYEGRGEEGIPVLRHIETEMKMPVCTEAGDMEQLEKLLDGGITNIWIGARSTESPFLMEKMARRLQREPGVSLLIKNPISGNINAFRGAIMRFLNRGIEDISLVLRGSHLPIGRIRNRNLCAYYLLEALRKDFPHIPLIIDPSHISGKTDYVEYVMKCYSEFHINGFMIECHTHPAVSQTDRDQLLHIAELAELVEKYRKPKTSFSRLQQLRLHLEEVDEVIFSLIRERMTYIKEIGAVKAMEGLPVVDLQRFNNYRERLLTPHTDVPEIYQYLEKFYQVLHDHAVAYQTAEQTPAVTETTSTRTV